MRFHGNQLSWAIKHHFISLCSKYQSPGFNCFPTMLAPVISSLDEIYCRKKKIKRRRLRKRRENLKLEMEMEKKKENQNEMSYKKNLDKKKN